MPIGCVRCPCREIHCCHVPTDKSETHGVYNVFGAFRTGAIMSRVLSLITCLGFAACVRGETLWIEAEKPAKANVVRHPWYSDVQRQLFSGGEGISHWDAAKAGEMEYVLKIPKAGAYDFWVRANPTGTILSYRLHNGAGGAS